MNTILLRRPKDVMPVRVAYRQQIAMIVHRAFGLARRARGKRDEADVVRRGRAGGKVGGGARHQRGEIVRRIRADGNDVAEPATRIAGLFNFVEQAVIAEGERNFSLLAGIDELLGTQQRHRRDDHAAEFDHGEIARDEQRIVGGAQEHPVSGYDAEARGQDVGDAVHALRELRIGPCLAGRRRRNNGAFAFAAFDPTVEQLRDAIDAFGIVEFRRGEDEVGLLIRRRKMISGETIDMRRIARHGGRPLPNCPQLPSKTGRLPLTKAR